MEHRRASVCDAERQAPLRPTGLTHPHPLPAMVMDGSLTTTTLEAMELLKSTVSSASAEAAAAAAKAHNDAMAAKDAAHSVAMGAKDEAHSEAAEALKPVPASCLREVGDFCLSSVCACHLCCTPRLGTLCEA